VLITEYLESQARSRTFNTIIEHGCDTACYRHALLLVIIVILYENRIIIISTHHQGIIISTRGISSGRHATSKDDGDYHRNRNLQTIISHSFNKTVEMWEVAIQVSLENQIGLFLGRFKTPKIF